MNKKIIGIILAIVLIASFVFVTPVLAEGVTITVGEDGGYDTIQEAVNNAEDGDTIQVYSGTYYESVLITESLTIVGVGDTKPVITGISGTSYIINIDTTSNVILDNLEIDSEDANDFKSGILINNAGMADSPVEIQNSIVRNIWINSSNGEGAITVKGGSYATIHDCTIESFEKRGVGFIGSAGEVYDCEIIGDDVDGTSRVQDLIVLWGGSNVEIYDNDLHNALTTEGFIPTWDSPAVFVSAYNSDGSSLASTANIHDNEIYDCDTGIVVGSFYTTGNDESTAIIESNIFHDLNTFINAEQSTVSFKVNDNIFNVTEDITIIGGDVSPTGTGNTFNISESARIEEAVRSSLSGDTINIASGDYEVGQIVIDKNLTIIGDSDNKPILSPIANITGINSDSAWILVQSDITFNLSNVIIDGYDKLVYQAIRSHGDSTIQDVDFYSIWGSTSGLPYRGVAIESFGGEIQGGAGSDTHGSGGSDSVLTVNDCTFEDIGRIGILVKGTGATADITGISYQGKGAIDCLDYGVEVSAGGSINVSESTITDNEGVASTDGSTSAGILVTDYYGTGTTAEINGNTLTYNTCGVAVGYDETDASVVVIHENDLSDNDFGVSSTNPLVDATLNWWGDATGAYEATLNPNGYGSPVDGNVLFDPWWADSDGIATGSNSNVLTIGITNGTVEINPEQDVYDYGTVVTLKVNAKSGYAFKEWAGDLSGKENPITIIMDSDKNVIVTMRELGGGGGGGGSIGSYTDTNILGKTGYLYQNTKGVTTKEFTSSNGELTINIPKGTEMTDKDGKPLNKFDVKPDNTSYPLPDNANVIGLQYSFTPNGAQFSPPMNITFKYSEADIPDGVNEGDLVIAYFDTVSNKWVELECVVDTVNNTITAKVDHFTTYAVIGIIKPVVTTTTTTPTETSTTITTTTNPPPTSETTATTTTATPTTSEAPTKTSTATTVTKVGYINGVAIGLIIVGAVLVVAIILIAVLGKKKQRK